MSAGLVLGKALVVTTERRPCGPSEQGPAGTRRRLTRGQVERCEVIEVIEVREVTR